MFFWIHFYNDIHLGAPLDWCSGFNPCFSGFTSTTRRRNRGRHAGDGVSILVFLDSLLQLYGNRERLRRIRTVSILVFLDSLLQHIGRDRKKRLQNRFNPCFSGFTSTTGKLGLYAGNTQVVSILVFLDSLLQRGAASSSMVAITAFQSLFFWIHFYNANSLINTSKFYTYTYIPPSRNRHKTRL